MILHSKESPDAHQGLYSRTVFGFWVYLMTDFMVFATLFATYAVLHDQIHGGPSTKDLFSLTDAFIQMLVILTASQFAGLGGAAAHRRHKRSTLTFFALAFVLGVIFLGMQINEFHDLAYSGHTWRGSAFLSIYFTLVGTHAIHVFFALLWFVVLIIPIFAYGLTASSIRRLTCLRIFWQFLGVVWVFIFSIVYLMGAK